MKARYVLLIMVLFLLAAVYAPASAIVIKKELPQLSQEASSVIMGRVVSMESKWEADRSIINTYVTIRVREHIKGAPTKSDVVVRVPGGEVDDMGLYISEAPWFEPNQEVIVFLTPESRGAHSVVGWYQGKFTIENGRVEELDLPVAEVENYIKGGIPNKAKRPPACYKLCGYTWLKNGAYSGGKYGPGNQGWSINNNNLDGMTDTQVATALTSATAAWNGAGACWDFRAYAGAITHSNITTTVQDYVNLITFGSTGGSVATTYNWYTRKARTAIIETDLVFDDGWLWGYNACGSANAFDLQEVATHELGHWLCLGDLYGITDAAKTMYGYVDYGECIKRTLDQCDIDGIKNIYGTCAAATPLADAKKAPGRASFGEIYYSVTEAGPVTVRIFDITGRLLKVVVDENQSPGTYRIAWDGATQAGSRAAAGVYFYRVETPGASWSSKLILVK